MSTPPTSRRSAWSACWSRARSAPAGCACAAGWWTSTAWVKDVVGLCVMDERPAADFRSLFFAAYQARPIAAPLELAQQLVFGAVEYARALGSGQPAALRRPPTKLRSWAARAPSASGATASLLRPGSARQRRRRAADAGASVGRGNFTFLVQA